jgi:GntR family transcriptional regulator
MQNRGPQKIDLVLGRKLVPHPTVAQIVSPASIVEWAKLALGSPQARVLRLKRLRFEAPGHPIAFEEVVLALDRFPGLEADGGDVPDIVELAQRYAISLGRSSERIGMVPASAEVAGHLGIAAGTDVLKLDRIAETIDGEPVEWRVAFQKV